MVYLFGRTIFKNIFLILFIYNVLGSNEEASASEDDFKESELTAKMHLGKKVLRGEAPFTVALYSGNDYICAGAIINPRTVITAAHCLDRYRNADTRSLSGAFGNVDRIIAHQIFFQEIRFHEQYDNNSLANDIAILITRKAFPYRKNVKEICIGDIDESFIGEPITMYSWGTLRDQLTTCPVYLRKGKFKIAVLTGPQCNENIGAWYLPYSILFYMTKDNYATSSDVGGPVVFQSGKSRYLVGIQTTSDCSRSHSHGIAVKVGWFAPWIRKESVGDVCFRRLEISSSGCC